MCAGVTRGLRGLLPHPGFPLAPAGCYDDEAPGDDGACEQNSLAPRNLAEMVGGLPVTGAQPALPNRNEERDGGDGERQVKETGEERGGARRSEGCALLFSGLGFLVAARPRGTRGGALRALSSLLPGVAAALSPACAHKLWPGRVHPGPSATMS